MVPGVKEDRKGKGKLSIELVLDLYSNLLIEIREIVSSLIGEATFALLLSLAIQKLKDKYPFKIRIDAICQEFRHYILFYRIPQNNNALYAIEKEKQESVLKEFYRILKPGGMIVISNPRKGASPFKIYLAHIKISIKTKGIIVTIKEILKMHGNR